jgi:hypothetical protein
MTFQEILNQLSSEGLRIASSDEAGWTYTYINEERERVTLWVTERV